MALPNPVERPSPHESSQAFEGLSRFELELEFVSSLANPFYLQYLAGQKYFDDPAFLAYLSYLSYWSQPKYAKYLLYPGPTLRALELLQQDKFRRDILAPETVNMLATRWVEDATASLEPTARS